MQFLQLIETIASNLSATNISDFINLVDGLVSLGENMLEHKSVAPAATSTPPTQQLEVLHNLAALWENPSRTVVTKKGHTMARHHKSHRGGEYAKN